MAIKKIRIRPEGSNNYADYLYPETSVDQVVGVDRYAVASGTNAYTATVGHVPSMFAGLRVIIKITNANTGASTLNINGLGTFNIYKAGNTALIGGNLKAGGVYTFVYDGSNFILQGEEGGGTGGTAVASDILSAKTATTDAGLITGNMPNRGAVYITPGVSNQAISSGYHNGSGVVYGDADLVAGNIKNGVNIFSVVGNLVPLTTERPWASGYLINSSSTYMSVTGLSFAPKIVLALDYATALPDPGFFINVADGNVNGGTVWKVMNGNRISSLNDSIMTLNSSGFYIGKVYDTVESSGLYWIAIG